MKPVKFGSSGISPIQNCSSPIKPDEVSVYFRMVKSKNVCSVKARDNFHLPCVRIFIVVSIDEELDHRLKNKFSFKDKCFLI